MHASISGLWSIWFFTVLKKIEILETLFGLAELFDDLHSPKQGDSRLTTRGSSNEFIEKGTHIVGRLSARKENYICSGCADLFCVNKPTIS